MEIPHDGIVDQYCCLVGFFALASHEQRTLIPNVAAPVYVSFNEGDGMFTRPLEILFGGLRDARSIVTARYGESGYTFVPERLNDALSDAVRALDSKWYGEESFFDTLMLDASEWDVLRVAGRDVWDALDEAHRVPFDDWLDWTG